MGGSCLRCPASPAPWGRRHWMPMGRSVPHLKGHHTYMTTARGHPRPQWDDLIAAFVNHGVLPDDTWQAVGQKTLSRDYRRPPACWSSETPSASGGTISGSAASTHGTRTPISNTPATSAGRVIRCPPPYLQAPTGARSAPKWPHAPGLSHLWAHANARRTEHYNGASRARGFPRTATRAPRVLPSCELTCTFGTPRPSRTCHTCGCPNLHLTPRIAGPATQCPANGGMDQCMPWPAAGHKMRPCGTWRQPR